MKALNNIFVTLAAGYLMCVSVDTVAQDRKSDINWLSLETAVTMAEENPKKIMLFMEADWCALCKKMKREVFPVSEIQQKIDSSFYAVRIDIESEEIVVFKGQEWTKKELSQDFGLYATPTFIFLESDQSVIGNKVGFMEKEEFLDLLSFIADEKYVNSEF